VVCWLLALIVTAVVPSFESLGKYSFPPIAWLADWPLAGPVLIFGVPGVVVLLAAIWWWRSGPAGRASRMGLSARLPGSGRLQRWSQAAIFAEMLLLLVERGVPLDRSLRLAAEAIDDAKLRRAAERLAERSRSGAAVSQSPNDPESRAEFPLLIRLALYHANNRSLLAGGLRQAAATYRERAVRAANWYAEYLPILLTVVIGGTLTISFTFSILWPYVSMLHDLAGWKWR
jgi:type II secretory pathway component PulF